MKMKIQEKGVVTIVTLEGNIMQEEIAMFRSRLDDLIMNGKIRIVLDMSGVNYLSSMGLSVLLATKNKLLSQRGDLKIASVNQLIKNLLEMTRLVRKLDVYESIDEAAVSYK